MKADTDERVEQEITSAILLGKKAAASRSKSPTKRPRIATDLDEDVVYISKRQWIYGAMSTEDTENIEDFGDTEDLGDTKRWRHERR